MAGEDFKDLFKFLNTSGENTANGTLGEPRRGGKTEWVFGRSSDCDYIYSAPKISRRHFKIELIESHYYVSDLGSTNGTYLNGKRIVRKERLFVGDVISMGDADIVFTKELLK